MRVQIIMDISIHGRVKNSLSVSCCKYKVFCREMQENQQVFSKKYHNYAKHRQFLQKCYHFFAQISRNHHLSPSDRLSSRTTSTKSTEKLCNSCKLDKFPPRLHLKTHAKPQKIALFSTRNRLLCYRTYQKIWSIPFFALPLQHLKDITITQYLNNARNLISNQQLKSTNILLNKIKKGRPFAFLFLLQTREPSPKT